MYARAIYPPNTPSRFAGLGYDPGWALGHIILLPLLSNLNKSMTMNHTLKFLRTFTLDEFKEWKGILQIRIIRNEQTGKHFFGYGDKAGAVEVSRRSARPSRHFGSSLRGERRAVPPASQCR